MKQSSNKAYAYLRFSILTLALFSFSACAQDSNSFDSSYSGSSSLPNMNAPQKDLRNKAISKRLKVKIFPHTFRKDNTHGVADYPHEVELKAQGLAILTEKLAPLYSTHVKIRRIEKKLEMTLDDGRKIQVEQASFSSTGRIQVIRKRNLDKTHHYEGEIKAIVHHNKILLINTIDIEKYLKGVVPKESVASWPMEALKAQAVAARTYAYYHLSISSNDVYDVDDTARYQVYGGASSEHKRTNRAILETSQEVLTHNGKVIVAFFHAYSGGRTEDSENIFPNFVPYCRAKDEIFTPEELREQLSSRSKWITGWTTDWYEKSELMAKFKSYRLTKKIFARFNQDQDFDMEEGEYNQAFDSVKNLYFTQGSEQVKLGFVKVRKALGTRVFPAYHFRLLQNDNNQIAFSGKGWGHHVGMSQWGAYMMAKKFAMSYRDILFHYYTDVELEVF